MGKKLLVALTMEGKFAGEGLQSIDETMTCSRRWHENWSREMELGNPPTPSGKL
jgi:hypothetical protein